MLKFLSINNYALIDQLEIDFYPGFSIITGETGAGKSILLGALALILGNRADTSVLRDKNRKCITEASFEIKNYQLQDFFLQHEIDYDDVVIVRREISNDGKSRAFINDSPVNLSVLKELGSKLVDIHSQHQNLNLGDHQYQLKVVDAYAQNYSLLETYSIQYSILRKYQVDLAGLLENAARTQADTDYFQFQFNQLEEAHLLKDEQEELEAELNALKHAEEIKTGLSASAEILSSEGPSVVVQLKECIHQMNRIKQVYKNAEEFLTRFDSLYIDLKELIADIEQASEKIEHNPERLEWVNQRLDLIYNLQQKHRVSTVQELIEIKERLQEQLSEINSFDEKIEQLNKNIASLLVIVNKLASELSSKRAASVDFIEKYVENLLKQLGIPNASFRIVLQRLEGLCNSGCDQLNFLFAANKQTELQEISKVASGGEMSRLMLAIKSLLARSLDMPTVIFDEIDMGVSGEIADKIGSIIKDMAQSMQVVNITHLPQIAGKGQYHYLVYKRDDKEATHTYIRLLKPDERVVEIAKMLSGESLTEAALTNARELLNR
jgi:DNA repair protein RecN (Recombination protein N)